MKRSSLREVEEMLLERGIDVSYETVRRWIAKFGPKIARNLRRRQARPGDIWYLDEVVVKCAGSSQCTQLLAIAFQFRPVAAPHKQFATIGSKLSMHGKSRPVSPEYLRAADLSSQRNLT